MISKPSISIGFSAALAAVLVVLTADVAHADTRLNGANQRWQTADKCTRTSFTRYPDYTVEGARKRDQFVRECLRNNRLPPRPDLAPSQPTAAAPE